MRMSRLQIVCVLAAALAALLSIAYLLFPDRGAYASLTMLVLLLVFFAAAFHCLANFHIRSIWQDAATVDAVNADLETRLGHVRALPNAHSVTGLPTFVVAKDRLNGAINRARRKNKFMAIYRVQLDAYGTTDAHYRGVPRTRAVKQKASRMRRMLRNSDSIIHVGTRDFLIIVEAFETLENLKVSNRKLAMALEIPVVRHDAAWIDIADKSAVAVYPMDGMSTRDLLHSLEKNFQRGLSVPAHTEGLLARL